MSVQPSEKLIIFVKVDKSISCRSANFQFKTLGAFFTNGEFFRMTTELVLASSVEILATKSMASALFYEASGGSAARSVKRHVQRSEIDCVRACDWRSSEGA